MIFFNVGLQWQIFWSVYLESKSNMNDFNDKVWVDAISRNNNNIDLSVFIYKSPLLFSKFLRKNVNGINVFILCVIITKLFFVYMCIKFGFSYLKIHLI